MRQRTPAVYILAGQRRGTLFAGLRRLIDRLRRRLDLHPPVLGMPA